MIIGSAWCRWWSILYWGSAFFCAFITSRRSSLRSRPRPATRRWWYARRKAGRGSPAFLASSAWWLRAIPSLTSSSARRLPVAGSKSLQVLICLLLAGLMRLLAWICLPGVWPFVDWGILFTVGIWADCSYSPQLLSWGSSVSLHSPLYFVELPLTLPPVVFWLLQHQRYPLLRIW